MLFMIAFALAPAAGALYLDRDLSCDVHIPIIGITAICVALCDALFGQIVSGTRWIPFCACYKPAEAQNLAKQFRTFHRKLFLSWMIAKICSSVAITISAVMMLKHLPASLQNLRSWILAIGYLSLGTAIVMAIEFIFTYFLAAEESDNAKLREMNYIYEKEHPELFKCDQVVIDEQLKGIPQGYNSPPITAKTVS